MRAVWVHTGQPVDARPLAASGALWLVEDGDGVRRVVSRSEVRLLAKLRWRAVDAAPGPRPSAALRRLIERDGESWS